jgi:hypothetical protein
MNRTEIAWNSCRRTWGKIYQKYIAGALAAARVGKFDKWSEDKTFIYRPASAGPGHYLGQN